jgi:hypothetical protein
MRFLVGSVEFALSNSSPVYHIKNFKSVISSSQIVLHRLRNLTSSSQISRVLLGASHRLRVKGYLKQPPLAGAQDSKHLHTLVRITDHILQEVKDARGLRVKVQMGRQNESFQSRESKDRKPEGTQRGTIKVRCISTSMCRRPIGVLKSDVVIRPLISHYK